MASVEDTISELLVVTAALTDAGFIHQAALEDLVDNQEVTSNGVADVIDQINGILQEFDSRLNFLRSLAQEAIGLSDEEFENEYSDFVEESEISEVEDVSLEELEATLSELLASIGSTSFTEGDEAGNAPTAVEYPDTEQVDAGDLNDVFAEIFGGTLTQGDVTAEQPAAGCGCEYCEGYNDGVQDAVAGEALV